jgi:hypothetical protein
MTHVAMWFVGHFFVFAHACVAHPAVWLLNDHPLAWRFHDLCCSVAVLTGVGEAAEHEDEHAWMRGVYYKPSPEKRWLKSK